ncbi:uncharacterized protein L969DRAFT_93845 [Mixia osmundae IAM 14324]|uniref:Uncharacterized protein n=1 Tax=Mixia osmundae (strain CBS 9802 / IAM 14324 / JCM 22182 / KY 12970) TaxID=764103 RepID=G7E9R7_MIXOS|nr:uncharacterized protein L969DRAFT_93845 [Mixia osmundae IAM 14324]KEI40017.1 hypothetical protein L969DRAFT_93845 [Mixia osmundae IAM 14324]GAA99386.1 hypothetical protein E5Q_06082 [Mixia osmundae IAM 14324]
MSNIAEDEAVAPLLPSDKAWQSAVKASHLTRRGRVIACIAVAFLLGLVYYVWQPSTPHSATVKQVRSTDLTVIAPWTGAILPDYVKRALDSWALNPGTEVLLLDIDDGEGCADITEWTDVHTHIRQLCITREQKIQRVVEFLCRHWSCQPSVREQVLAQVQEKDKRDDRHIIYKPWLGLIFREHVKTAWWAWADLDVRIGHFDELWPDIPDDVDIVTVSKSDKAGLWMAGQFTAFRLSDKADTLAFDYPPLSSPDTLQSLPTDFVDETSHSVWYLKEDSRWNWLVLRNSFSLDPKVDTHRLTYARGETLAVPQSVSRAQLVDWLDSKSTWPRAYRLYSKESYTLPLNITITGFGPPCYDDPYSPVGLCPHIIDNPISDAESFPMRIGGEYLQLVVPHMRGEDHTSRRLLFLHHYRSKTLDWFPFPSTSEYPHSVFEYTNHFFGIWPEHRTAPQSGWSTIACDRCDPTPGVTCSRCRSPQTSQMRIAGRLCLVYAACAVAASLSSVVTAGDHSFDKRFEQLSRVWTIKATGSVSFTDGNDSFMGFIKDAYVRLVIFSPRRGAPPTVEALGNKRVFTQVRERWLQQGSVGMVAVVDDIQRLEPAPAFMTRKFSVCCRAGWSVHFDLPFLDEGPDIMAQVESTMQWRICKPHHLAPQLQACHASLQPAYVSQVDSSRVKLEFIDDGLVDASKPPPSPQPEAQSGISNAS